MDEGPSRNTGVKCKKRSEIQACGFHMGTLRVEWGLPAPAALRALQALGQAGSSSARSGGNRGLAGCPPRLEDRSVEMGKVHAGMQG